MLDSQTEAERKSRLPQAVRCLDAFSEIFQEYSCMRRVLLDYVREKTTAFRL